jgi:hypothetical protein
MSRDIPPLTDRPTAQQLRCLAYAIRCEDDYLGEERFLQHFAAAVLAIWGEGGYIHRAQPTAAELRAVMFPPEQLGMFEEGQP